MHTAVNSFSVRVRGHQLSRFPLTAAECCGVLRLYVPLWKKPSAPWSASFACTKATPSGNWPGASVSRRISSLRWNGGHFPPPGEQKIVLVAENLDQNKDELLILAGKVSSDLIEIILQLPKETTVLLRRPNPWSSIHLKP
jgi:hypothetical protein